jgi:hypothetical protein
MSPKVFEENHLIYLLTDFDKNLSLDYLNRMSRFSDIVEDANLDGSLEQIEDRVLTKSIAMRMKFSEPLFVMLSHPICRMHMKIHYPIEFGWERFFVTKLGLLPVYSPSLNSITLVKFWADAAEQSTSQALDIVLKRGPVFMELRPSARPVRYSTMNFFLSYGSDLYQAPKAVGDLLRRYIVYSLWLGRKPGFSFSSHFLHTRGSIRYFLKVSKSLCLVDDIGRRTKLNISGRSIRVDRIKARILVEKAGHFYFQPVRAVVPNDVALELRSHPNLKEAFLNGIVMEVRDKENAIELLSVLVDIGASYYELAQTIIGYALMTHYYNNDHYTYVCTVSELKFDFEGMLMQIGRFVKLPLTVSDFIENVFDLALKSLEPLFIASNDEVYFLHPLLIGFLSSKKSLDLVLQNQTESTILVLKFLEKIRRKAHRMELYLDEALDLLRGHSKSKLIMEFASLARKIKFFKLMRKAFT